MSHLSPEDVGDVENALRDPHLATCEQCRLAVQEQRSVRDLLRALPEPAAAPPDVVRAIEATLRDVAAGASAPAARSVVPRAQPRTRHPNWAARAPRLVAVAAAAALVAGGGGLLVRRATTGDEGGASSVASAEMSPRPSSRVAAPPAPAATVRASGTAYTRERLTSQVRELLAPVPAREDAFASGTASGPLASASGLKGCLAALGTTSEPLVVDLATYDGAPAAVLVLPAAGGAREVWVVARDCRPGADGLRYYARLP